METETLEEASERLYPKKTRDFYYGDVELLKQEAFEEGAKWQMERSYSDDEVKKIAFDFYYDMSHKMNVPENLISENMTNVDVWFETFKNKK